MSALFDAFGLDWELLLIQIINFSIVLFVLWYFLYKPTMKMIDKRQKHIQKGVSDAEKARIELEKADEKKKEILSLANVEAERLIADGKRYAKEEHDRIVKEAMQASEDVLKDAIARGEEAKEELLHESKEEIAKMVVLGAEKILCEKRDMNEHHE